MLNKNILDLAMPKLVLIAHNIRSCHNVGSILRTADGLGVEVYLTGYSPYPKLKNDPRLPHQADKLDRQIHKTALGAEKTVTWNQQSDISVVIKTLHQNSFVVAGLEQAPGSHPLQTFSNQKDIALIIGNEAEGLEPEILANCDLVLEIPMLGKKESYNVVQAAAMALYHLRFVKVLK